MPVQHSRGNKYIHFPRNPAHAFTMLRIYFSSLPKRSREIDFASWRLCARKCLTLRRKGAKYVKAMDENEIAKKIVDAAYQLHRKLGPGLLESVYETVLAFELSQRELSVKRQVPVNIIYDGIRFDEGFRADLIVENKVIVELKSVETVLPVHKKQLLTYLRLTDTRLGLLINFGSGLIRDGISRIVNRLPE
jgi:GxxExxY protein